MERLKLEELARLVDDSPTAEEQALLDENPELWRELEALREQTQALSDLPQVQPPPAGWEALKRRLVAEGLVRRESGPVSAGGRSSSGSSLGDYTIWRKWVAAAAALVLFTGGTAFGWIAASAPPADGALGTREASLGEEEGAAGFASLEEARTAVQEAEREYLRRYGEYRRLQGGGGQRDPASRLAALEAVMAAGQVAVEQAPTDMFFNGILLNAMAEREQTLMQISQEGWH